MVRATDCRFGKDHDFSRISGWCVHGCGVRDDGRIVSRSGVVIESGPDYTAAQLDVFRQRTASIRGGA